MLAAGHSMRAEDDSARLETLAVLCPSRAIQASGLAGGYDCDLSGEHSP